MKDAKAHALCLLAQIAGGGLAGLADVEMSQTMPLGLPVGAIGGIALAAAGFALSSGKNEKIGTYMLDIGGGMLAFESGTAVVNRVLKAKAAAIAAQPAAVAGILPGMPASAGSFVSQTPANERVITREILAQHMARARQHAASARR